MDFLFVSDSRALTPTYTRLLNRWWGSFLEFPLGDGLLFIRQTNPERCFIQDDHVAVYLQGYIRQRNASLDSEAAHNLAYGHAVAKSGNAKDVSDFSGCFSAFVYCKESRSCYLTSEWGAVYPIYYFVGRSVFWASSSIILLGAISNSVVDEVGIGQLMFFRAGVVYGRRTFLKNVLQLKGDERLAYRQGDQGVQYFYTIGLYNNISEDEKLKDAASRLWEQIKQEYHSALLFEPEVHTAQSGGLDSRLMLAAIPPGKEVFCHTYGDDDFYETKIAHRCAQIRKAHWQNYEIGNFFLPKRSMIDQSIQRCDEFEFGCWLALFDQMHAKRQCFLVGDLFEAFSGRGIEAYYQRDRQVSAFVKHYLFNQQLQFNTSSKSRFDQWKDTKINEIIRMFDSKDRSSFEMKPKDLAEASIADFEINARFVERQNPPYCELFDEALGWNCIQDRQLILGKNLVYPMSPGMSNHLLSVSSSIHPKLRVNYRLADAIFRLPELKPYAGLPTAQVPFIPFSWPNFVKLLVWGGRSKVDRLLVRRMMAKQNPNLRYRLVPGLNFPKMYQNPMMFQIVEEWFHSDPYGFKTLVVNTFDKRRILKRTPILPMREFGLAALMAKLNAIDELKTIR